MSLLLLHLQPQVIHVCVVFYACDIALMCMFCPQVQTALGAIVREPAARDLPCGVFGSFGWSGEAVDELENRLKVSHACFSPAALALTACMLLLLQSSC